MSSAVREVPLKQSNAPTVNVHVPPLPEEEAGSAEKVHVTVDVALTESWRDAERRPPYQLLIKVALSSNRAAWICNQELPEGDGFLRVNPRECPEFGFDHSHGHVDYPPVLQEHHGEYVLKLPSFARSPDHAGSRVSVTYRVDLGHLRLDQERTSPPPDAPLTSNTASWSNPGSDLVVRALDDTVRSRNQVAIYVEGLALALAVNLFSSSMLSLAALRQPLAPHAVGAGAVLALLTPLAAVLLLGSAWALVVAPLGSCVLYALLSHLGRRRHFFAPPRLEPLSWPHILLAANLLLYSVLSLREQEAGNTLIASAYLVAFLAVLPALAAQAWFAETAGRTAALALMFMLIPGPLALLVFWVPDLVVVPFIFLAAELILVLVFLAVACTSYCLTEKMVLSSALGSITAPAVVMLLA